MSRKRALCKPNNSPIHTPLPITTAKPGMQVNTTHPGFFAYHSATMKKIQTL